MTNVLTVSALREVLADLPGDAPVLLSESDLVSAHAATSCKVVGVDLRDVNASCRFPHQPAGKYLGSHKQSLLIL